MDISKAVCRDNSKFPMLWKCNKVIGNDLFVPPGVSMDSRMENWMFVELPRAAIVKRIRVTQVMRVMQSARGCSTRFIVGFICRTFHLFVVLSCRQGAQADSNLFFLGR